MAWPALARHTRQAPPPASISSALGHPSYSCTAGHGDLSSRTQSLLPILGGEPGPGHLLTSAQTTPYNLGLRTGYLGAATLRRIRGANGKGTFCRSFWNSPVRSTLPAFTSQWPRANPVPGHYEHNQKLSGYEGQEATGHIQRWPGGGAGCRHGPAPTVCTLTSLASWEPAEVPRVKLCTDLAMLLTSHGVQSPCL